MLTRGDLVLIAIILLFSAIFIHATLTGPDPGGGEVVVTLRGEEIARYPLEDGSRIETFRFTVDDRTYTGNLEFDGGRVRLHRLSRDISPLPIHADMGWIGRPGQVIVSVPVQMKVHIEGAEGPSRDEPQIDAIAGSH